MFPGLTDDEIRQTHGDATEDHAGAYRLLLGSAAAGLIVFWVISWIQR